MFSRLILNRHLITIIITPKVYLNAYMVCAAMLYSHKLFSTNISTLAVLTAERLLWNMIKKKKKIKPDNKYQQTNDLSIKL